MLLIFLRNPFNIGNRVVLRFSPPLAGRRTVTATTQLWNETSGILTEKNVCMS